jgi:hypothetical protein
MQPFDRDQVYLSAEEVLQVKGEVHEVLNVGFSNSTRISMSLVSFCSPLAKEPKRPILLTPKQALRES